jgi:hypothetical protein
MLTLSLVAAHVNAPDWAELFIKSVRKFTASEYEIIIIDNGSCDKNLEWLRNEAKARRIQLIENGRNLGHGGAIDQGTRLAKGHYVCHMDIDSFFQRRAWDVDIIEIYHSDPLIRLIAVRGWEQPPYFKPLGAPIFFYEKEFALQNKIIFNHMPGTIKGSTGPAQWAYWQILELGYKVERIGMGEKIYDKEALGDEFWIKGQPTIYHHWYGTRFSEHWEPKKHQSVDGKSLESYLKRKENIFNQPLVKEILNGE